MKRTLILISLVILINPVLTLAREIPFTQEDRDRLVRLETKMEEGFRAINQRIEDTKGI